MTREELVLLMKIAGLKHSTAAGGLVDQFYSPNFDNRQKGELLVTISDNAAGCVLIGDGPDNFVRDTHFDACRYEKCYQTYLDLTGGT